MISIITSSYNSEKTIVRTIDSVLNQTHSDFELIIVNDCSTDKSLEIINSYKDERIKVINNDKNYGAGISRLNGIKSAKGDYITFLDSDDYYNPNSLELLVRAAKRYDADVVIPGYVSEDINGKVLNKRVPEFKVEEGQETLTPNKADTKRFLNIMLVKKELFDKVEYSKRRFIEDTPTLFKLLYLAQRTVTIPEITYHYYQRDDSLIHSASEVKYKIYEALATKDILEFIMQREKDVDVGVFVSKIKVLSKYVDNPEFDNYKGETNELFKFLITLIR